MPLRDATFGAAERSYELIRESKSDVAVIARNIGYTNESINKIKAHLFLDRHLLDRYVQQGVPVTFARFDADSEIAEAWQRLVGGTHTPEDLALLRHEMSEACFMRNVD